MAQHKLLIDTNVLIDVLARREGFYEASATVWKLCESGAADGYISALSVANIIYIMRKTLDPAKTSTVISHLSLIFDIADLKAADLKAAADLNVPDFEDALQMCCARRVGADFIVTRNVRDFSGSPVMAVSPEELICHM